MYHHMIKPSGSTVTTIEFTSEREGFLQPDAKGRVINFASDQTPWVSDFGGKKRWEIDISFISAADYAKVYSWWDNITTCTFYPDYATPATITLNYDVLIVNDMNPLYMINWKDKYKGHISLHEV